MPTFDGANKLITLDENVYTVEVLELYSEWKRWSISQGTQFAPAFRVIGGDPLGGGLFAGSYFFLQNDSGWRIKPPEQNIVIQLNGNLFAENAGLPLFVITDGAFNTSIRLQTSSLTQGITTEGGGAATVDNAAIAAAVWNHTQ